VDRSAGFKAVLIGFGLLRFVNVSRGRSVRTHKPLFELSDSEKLRADAAECQLISDLATNPNKRHLFAKLAEHHRTLAKEVERSLEERRAVGER
jgi:hypothetical protein